MGQSMHTSFSDLVLRLVNTISSFRYAERVLLFKMYCISTLPFPLIGKGMGQSMHTSFSDLVLRLVNTISSFRYAVSCFQSQML